MSTWICIKTTIESELWASLCCHVITQPSYQKTYILQFWCLKQYNHFHAFRRRSLKSCWDQALFPGLTTPRLKEKGEHAHVCAHVSLSTHLSCYLPCSSMHWKQWIQQHPFSAHDVRELESVFRVLIYSFCLIPSLKNMSEKRKPLVRAHISQG